MLIKSGKVDIMDGRIAKDKKYVQENNLNFAKKDTDGCKTKLCRVFENITVEPLLACYVIPSMIMLMAAQNFNLEKACRVNINYNKEICDRMISQTDVTNLTEQIQKVQKVVTAMQVWKLPLQTVFPSILIIFVGSWADRTGKKKLFMITPPLGDAISCVGLFFCVYYFLEWPLEIAALFEAIPSALGGGFAVLFVSAYIYVTDITTEENRTFRLGIANIVAVVGMPVGLALSGVIVKYAGYYGVFSLVGALYITAIIYACVRIQDNNVKAINSERRAASFLDFFNPKHVIDTFMVLFKRRDGNKRLYLIVLVIMAVFVAGPSFGELGVLYLFARYKFGFTEVEYSIFGTYSSIIHLTGTMIAIGVLNRRYNVNDYLLGILASTSKIVGSFMFAFAPTTTWFYMGPLVECFSGFGSIIVKTITSKIVEPEEVGRMYSIIGILDAMAPTIYTPIYSTVYFHTIERFPGSFFFIGTISAIPCVIAYICMYVSYRKAPSEDSIDEEGVIDGVVSRSTDQIANKEMYARDNPIDVMCRCE